MSYKRTISAWISTLLVMGVMACGTSQQKADASALLTVEQLKTMIKEVSNLQLVDVRTPEEYAAGHLEGAVNINYHADDFETQLAGLDLERPTVLYCARGGRSHKAYLLGKPMKFKQLYDLEGGYNAWATAQ